MGVGRDLRISEFVDQGDRRSVVLQASHGIALGDSEDERLDEALEALAGAGVDGVIMSRGLANRYSRIFHGRHAPAMLLSLDWTNAFRGTAHPLPMMRLEHQVLTEVEDALMLGASGVVAYFFVGYERDEYEARNLEDVAAICRECDGLEMPLMVQAIPVGERVTKENYADSLALASRMAMEAGADLLAVPYAGSSEAAGRIAAGLKVPTLLMDLELNLAKGQPEYALEDVVAEALDAGVSGLLLGRRYLDPRRIREAEGLIRLVHRG
jgi:DhnA family fructose-bisphosphate aldolase class Ia